MKRLRDIRGPQRSQGANRRIVQCRHHLREPDPSRIRLATSPSVMSRTYCDRFSIDKCPRAPVTNRLASARELGTLVMRQRTSREVFSFRATSLLIRLTEATLEQSRSSFRAVVALGVRLASRPCPLSSVVAGSSASSRILRCGGGKGAVTSGAKAAAMSRRSVGWFSSTNTRESPPTSSPSLAEVTLKEHRIINDQSPLQDPSMQRPEGRLVLIDLRHRRSGRPPGDASGPTRRPPARAVAQSSSCRPSSPEPICQSGRRPSVA